MSEKRKKRPAAPHTLTALTKRLILAMGAWVKGGLKVADEKTLRHRAKTCHKCPSYNARARMGLGRCAECGCTSAKLLIPDQKCPLDKW